MPQHTFYNGTLSRIQSDTEFRRLLNGCHNLEISHVRPAEKLEHTLIDDGSSQLEITVQESSVKLGLTELVLEYPHVNNGGLLFSNTLWVWSRIQHLELHSEHFIPFTADNMVALQAIAAQIKSLCTLVITGINPHNKSYRHRGAAQMLDEFAKASTV
jgi:hypothetical protein